MCVCTYSSRYKSGSPVVCTGRGHGHRQGRAGQGHMICTEMGGWPTGLMTSHHSGDRFCSSGGENKNTYNIRDIDPKFSTENKTCVCVHHLAVPSGAWCAIQRWCETVCVVGFITAFTYHQHPIIASQPNTQTHTAHSGPLN